MSALTDLFSALANKIRAKTGGSDTYTPPQMVAAIDDVYDAGVAAGTVPTQTKETTAGTSDVTVTPDSGYHLSSVTVHPTPSETKTQAAGTSNIDVTPTSGKLLSKVTVTPQQHSGTYTPAANTAANDMGASHNNRYVNTSGMIVPSGNKSITANGTGIDVSSYATASVNVPNPTLSGDAATGNVLSGKTFYNSSYTKQTGSMTNNGAVSQSLNCGGSYTVPSGYHNGSGTVTANSLASQTGVDSGKTAIDASHVISGYQGWVNGSKISGTVSSKAAATYNTSTSDQTIASGQYLSGTQTIKAVTTSNITAGNIKSGVTIYVGDSNSAGRIKQVTGTYTGSSGGFTSTTLWTNSSPTSSFAGQSVSWSGSYGTNDFDFIEIKYRYSTSNSTSTSVYMTKEDFANTGGTSSGTMRCNLGCYDGNNNYGRGAACGLGFVVSFGGCYKLTTSSANTVNTMLIPTAIIGHNFK